MTSGENVLVFLSYRMFPMRKDEKQRDITPNDIFDCILDINSTAKRSASTRILYAR